MPADESHDPPLSVFTALAARYPRWTIWFGHSTRHWWALPPRDRDIGDFVEAPSVKELVSSIEDIQGLRRDTSRAPAMAGAGAARNRRIPAAAWPGSAVR